jgi:hypothetical protein
MATVELIDNLNLRNRAYNLLYSLGQDPGDVETLTDEEAQRLVKLADEVYRLEGDTFFHRLIRTRVPVHHLRYVATGKI